MTYIGKRRRWVRRPKPNTVGTPIEVPEWPKPQEVPEPIEAPNWPMPVTIPADPGKTS